MAAFQTIVGVEMVEIVVTRDELITHLAKKDVEPRPLEKQTHRTISKHGQGLLWINLIQPYTTFSFNQGKISMQAKTQRVFFSSFLKT